MRLKILLISRNGVPLKIKTLYLLNAQKQGIQTSRNFSNRVSVPSRKLHSMLFSVVFLWQCQRLTIKIVGLGINGHVSKHFEPCEFCDLIDLKEREVLHSPVLVKNERKIANSGT